MKVLSRLGESSPREFYLSYETVGYIDVRLGYLSKVPAETYRPSQLNLYAGYITDSLGK